MTPNDYWIHEGQPIHLPAEMLDSEGSIWTDLANNETAQEKLGLVKAPAFPDGYDPATKAVAWENGAWVVSDLPPPPPAPPEPDPELPKSLVTNRLITIGKIDSVYDVLAANKGMFALWFAPDWQHVIVTDPRVTGLLQGAGLTAAEIDEILNPDPAYMPPAA